MDRQLHPALLKALERDNLGLVRDGAAIEGEGHVHHTVGRIRREGGLSGDGVALGVGQDGLSHVAVLIGALDMEGALDGVLTARDEVVVGHGVADGHGVIDHDVLVAVRTIHGGGADGGRRHGDGLVHVLNVLMGNQLIPVLGKALESHELRAGLKGAGVEGEGHVDRAAALLSREGSLGGDGLAVHLKRLAGGLVHERAGDRVLLAGDEAVIRNGVHDGGFAVSDHVLVAIYTVHGGGADGRVLDGDGLVHVLDVGMDRQLTSILAQGLEGDELRAVVKGGGVEGEGHLDRAVCRLGREGGLGGNGLAVHLKGLAGGLVVERAGDGILLADGKVLVGNGINDVHRRVGGDVLVAVRTVGGGGADFRHDDLELLVHIVLVEVRSGEGAVREVQLLEDRDGPTAQLVGGQRHLHDLVPGRPGGGESRGGAHGLAVHGDGVAGLSIDHGGDERVLLTLGEAGVGHFVGDGHLAHGDALVAVHGVVCGGGDFRLHVIERAEVIGHAVTGDGDGGLDEGVALVGGAAQLLDGVSVIRERAARVVRRRHVPIGGEAKPSARRHVELGAVDDAIGVQRPVVAVGVVAVLVPRGGGAKVTVLIGHDDMALAGGLAGHLEGHTRKTLGGGIGLLGELKVCALDLIVDVTVLGGSRVHEHAVLGDGELIGLAVEIVPLGALGLLQGVVASGEQALGGRGIAVLDGEGSDHIALAVGQTAHHDRVVVEGSNLEGDAIEGGSAAQRRAEVGFDVALGDFHAAAHDLIGSGELVHLAVLGDGDVHVVGGVQEGIVGLALADGEAAVGQGVGTRGGAPVVIGGDGHDDLAGGEGLPAHDDVVLVVVDDGELDTREARAALRGRPGRSVHLLDGNAATDDLFRCLCGVVGNGRVGGFLNLLEAHVILVEDVSLRCLGLVHHECSTRNLNLAVKVEQLIA